ncbi:TIGR00255 family protein [Tangfeifania diversioriginum]|uniref:TIGR00255 family protein n=1 Tax=Tangfeifania diversioriginum TaxID=1168035 RepID=A0A1M6JUF7_9BACT|nr:YicC/YloC family endoribonuclease [Tangfeifania diversioriginum]SHJ50327.1 TIGR00255 family protein [Tangfeifania diversioriginum]
MIKSMTGFGRAEFEVNNKKITLEIKSLNSKQIDINTRIPSLYREKEIEIRKELSEKLVRGKIDLTIYLENHGEESNSKINEPILKSYFGHLKKINDDLKLLTDNSTLHAALRLPDVVKTEYETLDEEEWQVILENIREAIQQIIEFRLQEGKALENDISENVNSISELLQKIGPFETQRIETVKSRLNDSLGKSNMTENVDKNRFEQELIYYLDKMDMNEEKVRLENHCSYFLETLNQDSQSANGKKLAFISQEMGREINTIGSKAYESNIQRVVVEMKDHLERIKEQLLNVL